MVHIKKKMATWSGRKFWQHSDANTEVAAFLLSCSSWSTVCALQWEAPLAKSGKVSTFWIIFFN